MADDILAELQRAIDAGAPTEVSRDPAALLAELEAAAAGHEERVGKILSDFLSARAEISSQPSQADRDAEIARIKAEANL